MASKHTRKDLKQGIGKQLADLCDQFMSQMGDFDPTHYYLTHKVNNSYSSIQCGRKIGKTLEIDIEYVPEEFRES